MSDIFYSESLIQFFEMSLRRAFCRRCNVALSRKPRNSGGEFNVQILNPSNTAYLDNGFGQPVTEIECKNRSAMFYFGLRAPFVLKTKGSYALDSVSLTVFHRVHEDILPIFRAEWDRTAAMSTDSEHCQPHWHFVHNPSRIEALVLGLLNENIEAREFRPVVPEAKLFSGNADFGKIHFAMTSIWNNEGVVPPKRVFNSTDFKPWFEGLTAYIANQIAYAVGKMPSARFETFEADE